METLENLINHVAGSTDLERLSDASREAGELTELADLLVGHYVDVARRGGESWSAIGDTLGLSKQGAQQRFAPRGPVDAANLDGPAFSRFTDRARHALAAARDAALARGDGLIEPGHVILGICTDTKSFASRAFVAQGVTVAQVRHDVRAGLSVTSEPSTEPQFGSQTRLALDAALREALRFGHSYIGTEHLVLGLLAQDQAAATLALGRIGVTYPQMRATLEGMLATFTQKLHRRTLRG